MILSRIRDFLPMAALLAGVTALSACNQPLNFDLRGGLVVPPTPAAGPVRVNPVRGVYILRRRAGGHTSTAAGVVR